ncbi:uncharacterized protein LOC131615957 isoform X3 [Vicia villosa]|uniref:uncharacterized protein LOC131615957 isoform X3 n=1 Tax=Vicia villosa TaxID=3911 RepID=UPI00273AB5F7|nr:uncharacterized protein LOC131615957 isoform X3 [Vicia villosa]
MSMFASSDLMFFQALDLLLRIFTFMGILVLPLNYLLITLLELLLHSMLRRQHLKKKEEEEMALLTFSAVAGLKPPCDADGYHPVLYIEFQRDQENERIEAKESHIMEIQINGGTIAQKVDFAYNFFTFFRSIQLACT